MSAAKKTPKMPFCGTVKSLLAAKTSGKLRGVKAYETPDDHTSEHGLEFRKGSVVVCRLEGDEIAEHLAKRLGFTFVK